MLERYRLLFVDNKDGLLRSLNSVLRRDYDIYTIATEFDALEILSRKSINVIISAQVPSENDVLSMVFDQYPDVVRVLAVSDTRRELIKKYQSDSPFFAVITSPWSITDIKGTIARAAIASTKLSPQKWRPHVLSTSTEMPEQPTEEVIVKPPVMDTAVPFKPKASALQRKTRDRSGHQQVDKAINKVSAGTAAESRDISEQKISEQKNKTQGAVRLKSTVVASIDKKQGNASTEVGIPSILLLDQDQATRNTIRTMSRRHGLGIYGTSSYVQALRILSIRPHIGIVIIGDIEDSTPMLEVVRSLKQQGSSDQCVIVLSSQLNYEDKIKLLNEGSVFRYLEKPLATRDYERAIAAAMKRQKMLQQLTDLNEQYQAGNLSKTTAEKLEKLNAFFKQSA